MTTQYIVTFGYLILIAVLGSLFARQKSSTDFFLAGRSIHWLPVAISYVASLTSAISFMSMPMWTYRYAMLPALNEIFVIAFALPVMIVIFLPLYGRIGVVSIYEFLEHRFGLSIRMIGSLLFLLNRFVWMGLVIYTPSIALSYMTGIDIRVLIVVIGLLTTVYTCLGGMKAVIWTDVVQFFILMGGIVAVLWVVASKVDGGLAGVIQVGVDMDKIKFVRWELTWETPNTLVLALGAIYGFQNYAADQVVIQRFLSTPSIRDSIKSFIACCGINYVLIFLLYLVGAFLFVFYQQFPGEVQGIEENLIYPHFILNELPVVFGGLVIAAIMAASMSSVDSGINSMSAVLISDYYRRLIRADAGEDHYLRFSRGLAVGLGILVVVVGLLVNAFGKNLLDTVLITHGWFAPPISAVFILGAMTKRMNVVGALATCVLSPAIMITITKIAAITKALGLPEVRGLPPWSFGIAGMTVALVIGYAASWLGRPPSAENLRYCQTLSMLLGRKEPKV